MNRYISIVSAVAVAAISSLRVSAQNFGDIFDAMPGMTLDQQYSALLDYQKANPYFGNTYLQLGVVCEKKMVLFDPLREYESVKFWADNATLFFGNLKIYYKPNEVKSSSEYYGNINIPYTGKRVEDADLWRYVQNHSDNCKSHRDSAGLIYAAIEKSKFNYNMAIRTYMSICEKYMDYNEMLLRNGKELNADLKTLGDYIDQCVASFADYKRLLKLYPILSYNQFYEFKRLETYRLDGLTNSDFYASRFNIWDYREWIDKYYKVFNSDIKPLRDEVAAIDAKFHQGREDYDTGKPQNAVLASPFDDDFVFRLCRYDNSSLVAELFRYLDTTRDLVALAGDSLGLNIPYSNALTARKMRHLYRMVAQNGVAEASRAKLLSAISPEKIANFSDFFGHNYGGESGLRKFLSGEADYCQSLINTTAENLAAYVGSLDAENRAGLADSYSVPNGAQPALPLWVALEPKTLTGKHVTTHVAHDRRGSVAAVGGYLKANNRSWFVAGISDDLSTKWVTALKNVNSISRVEALRHGCIVCAIRQLKPVIIVLDENGNEVSSVKTDVEVFDRVGVKSVSGCAYWLSGANEGRPVLATADSLGVQKWSVGLPSLRTVDCLFSLADGFVVGGTDATGAVSVVRVSSDGVPSQPVSLMSDAKSIMVATPASATEFGLLLTMADGKHRYVIMSDKGEVIKK